MNSLPLNASPFFTEFLYGADYNPDQWLNEKDILSEDLRLMKLAHLNAVSIGIFAWSKLEPEEGRYEFGWLDSVLEGLAAAKIQVILATPSGSKPAWMSMKYPEVCRCQQNGMREPHYGRHNHCMTSPVYRAKVHQLNTLLAERYKNHPSPILWHVSNEYGGHCFCPLCQKAFQVWLQKRYESLDRLNQAWWTSFWGHTYSDWSQINFTDGSIHGLVIDWWRFMTDQAVDFFRAECEPLRRITPNRPVTTNMMGVGFRDYNNWKFVPYVDIVSFDSYPYWHSEIDEIQIAADTAFEHDLFRSMKRGQPYLLQEMTPSQTNWQPVSRPKLPGFNRLSALQALAHGSNSVLYFQFRKGLGGSEKFHGAIVDHVGHENTRVFREAAALGKELELLSPLAQSVVQSEVALIYDMENRWGIENSFGPRNQDKRYVETCQAHHRSLWKKGVSVDVIDSVCDLAGYRVVVAPMLYMLRPGVAERLTAFVASGGTLVGTYLTGLVNETDCCFRGGAPGPLRSVFGIWVEETDVLHERDLQKVRPLDPNHLGFSETYDARHFCDVVHLDGANLMASYENQYYAGSPALTANIYGSGKAYYVASRNEDKFLDDFLGAVLRERRIAPAQHRTLPPGVSQHKRASTTSEFFCFLNFNNHSVTLDLGEQDYSYLSNHAPVPPTITLKGFDAIVLKKTLQTEALR